MNLCNLIAFTFCVFLHLMKLAIHIFTIYMFALSLTPCGDGGNGVSELANHIFGVEHQHVSDHEQHSNGCGDDTCTPFCVCNCCSISVNIPSTIDFYNKNLILVFEKHPFYKSNFYPSGYNTFVWQPPKFS